MDIYELEGHIMDLERMLEDAHSSFDRLTGPDYDPTTNPDHDDYYQQDLIELESEIAQLEQDLIMARAKYQRFIENNY